MSQEQKPDLKSVTDVATVFEAMPTLFRRGMIYLQLSYYFSIDEHEWTVLVGPETCEVREGKPAEEADCYLKTTEQIFLGTLRGDYLPSLMDFLQGRVKTNRPELLLDLKKIFTDD
jgi:long-chain acyl-CoA synthetase